MSQSSALTPEQQADVANQRKNGIHGAAIISAVLLLLYFFIAQFVGILGFLIFALILTLSWWSVLRKNAYKPKETTPPHIAPAIQPPAAPQEPAQAIRSSTTPSHSILPSAPQATEESKLAPPISTLTPMSSPAVLHSPVFSDREKVLLQRQTIISEVLTEQEKEEQSQPTPTSNRPAPLVALLTEPQERTPVQAEQSLVPEPTQQGVVVSGRSEIGTDTHTGQLVHISQANRRQGLYMIGVNGTGKSTLLAHLIVQDIEQGLGVCLLDPHGDLTAQVLARVPENRVQDVVLLDLMDSRYPFGLNLFACPNAQDIEHVAFTAGFVMHVFEKVWGVGTETPLLSQFLRNVTYTLISNPGMTFAEIPHLLVDETAREKLVGNVKNNQVRLFWQTYNRLRSTDQLERASGTLNKADAFLTQPIIANIVGQSKATVNFRTMMDTGKILLVQLTPRLEDISNLIGAVIIGQLLNAALSRKDIPEEKRRQFNLYADEFQRFATEDFATLLSEARKFGVATTIAHQYLDQLDHANRGASVNAANLIVFRVSGQDAAELAKEFDTTPPPPDIIGQRPLFSPKRDVVDHLVKNGHKNPMVNTFASEYIVSLTDVLRQNANRQTIDWMDKTKFFELSFLAVDDLREGIHELNNILYACMVDHNAQKPISPYTLLAAAFCCKFTQGVGIGEFSYNSNWKHRFKPKQVTLALCQPDVFSHLEELKIQVSKKEKFEQAIAFLRSLRSAMEALAVDPILVDTGQHEPIYDKPRTYADVQNEIATRLTNLPNYRAKVKTIGQEHTIQTLPLSSGLTSQSLVSRRELVISHTRSLYCRPRSEIEQEILDRQEELTRPVKKQAKAKPVEDEE